MNQIDFTKLGGFPLTQDSLDFLQQAYKAALGGLSSPVGDVALSGAVVTLGTIYIGGVTTDNVTAGFVVINGEVCVVDAHSSQSMVGDTVVWYIQTTTDLTLDPTDFGNASTNNVHLVRKARIAPLNTLPGGTYNVPVADMKAWPVAVADKLVGDTWHAATLAFDVVPGDTWLNYNDYGSAIDNPNYHNAEYRKTNFGKVELRGYITHPDLNTGTGDVNPTGEYVPIFTLPAAYRPAKNIELFISWLDGSGIPHHGWIIIHRAGDATRPGMVSIHPLQPTSPLRGFVSLNGLTFDLA